MAIVGEFTKIEQINSVIGDGNSDEISLNNTQIYNDLNTLQDSQENIIVVANTEYYKKLFYINLFNLNTNTIHIVLSEALKNYKGFSEYAFEVKGGGEKISTLGIIDGILNDERLIQRIDDKVVEYIYNMPDKYIDDLAIKIIERMHINSVDFTYAPVIARVTIIDENGEPINLDLNKENGIYKATADLNGRYTIQLSTRTDL